MAGARAFIYTEEFIELNVLVREIVDTFQQTTSTHTLRVHGAVSSPFVGDRRSLEQVVNNLISSAIKYSPQADAIDIRLLQEEETILIRVQDYGVGILREQQGGIVDRFQRGEYTRRERAFPGLGMGLYIAHEIIKHYHGSILVDSDAGEGAIFAIVLPLHWR